MGLPRRSATARSDLTMCSPYAASVHTVVQTFVIHRSASPVRVRQRLLPLLHHCCGPARRGEPCPTAIATATSAVAIATITTTLPRCRRAFPSSLTPLSLTPPSLLPMRTLLVSHVTSLAQRTAPSRVVRVLTSTTGSRLCTPQGTAELLCSLYHTTARVLGITYRLDMLQAYSCTNTESVHIDCDTHDKRLDSTPFTAPSGDTRRSRSILST